MHRYRMTYFIAVKVQLFYLSVTAELLNCIALMSRVSMHFFLFIYIQMRDVDFGKKERFFY